MAVLHGTSVILSDTNGFAERHEVTEVSSDVFKVVGRRPLLGRDFLPSDGMPGAPPVAILRYDFWEHRFAKDPAIIPAPPFRPPGNPLNAALCDIRYLQVPLKQTIVRQEA